MMHQWWTWPNLLTAARLGLVAPLLYCILHSLWPWAWLLFVVAVITDVWDGKLARRLSQSSPLGGLFDHSTDAVLVSFSCGALAIQGLFNPWLAALILLAFLQYMLDSSALSGVALRTSRLGRLNGVAYYVLVGVALFALWQDIAWLQQPIVGLAWLLVMSTLLSMLDRLLTLLRRRRPTV